jgi:hypothetical protein
MDLDGGVIHKEGRLKGWALKSRLFWALKWERVYVKCLRARNCRKIRHENLASCT